MGNQTYRNSPCPSATTESRVCSHPDSRRRMPRANPTTAAAVVRRIHCTDAKNSRDRRREKGCPLSPRKNCALTASRIRNIQRTPVLVPSDAESKDVMLSANPSFTRHRFTSVYPKHPVQLTQPQQQWTPQLRPGTILLQVVPLCVIGADGLAVTTYAMLDSASEITLVDPSLVCSLRLSGRPDQLVLSTVSNQDPQGERVDLVVESITDEQPQQLQLKGVWSGTTFQHSTAPPMHHQRQGKMGASP